MELKFRVFIKSTNEMRYIIGFLGNVFDKDIIRIWYINNEFVCSESFYKSDIIFMTYTGINDKTGKELYENDIWNTSNDGKDGYDIWDFERSKNNIVRWNSIYHSFKGLPDGEENSIENLKYITIIGNIHQNPELLK